MEKRTGAVLYDRDDSLCMTDNRSAQFLFQIAEDVIVKKGADRNAEPIAEFFDGRNCCAVVSAADDVVYGGLRDTADGTKFVDGKVMLVAQRQDADLDRFTDYHNSHPFKQRLINFSCNP